MDPSVERAFVRYVERPNGRRLGKVAELALPEVWSLAVQLAGSEEDARDLCQDLFLSLLLNPPRPASVRSVRGYLCARVATLAANKRRAARRRRQHEVASFRRIAEAESLPMEDAEALREAIEGLPEKLRTAVELKYLASQTNGQIASALDVSERSVIAYLARARDILETETHGELVLSAEVELNEIEIVLRPLRSADRMIIGFVVDAGGRPLPGIRIECWQRRIEGELPGAVTDENGEFRISFQSDHGECQLMASGEGWAPAFRAVENVGTADRPTRLRIPLERPHWLGGRVLDERGHPLAGAQVSAAPSNDDFRRLVDSATTETDTRGRFRLEGLTGPGVRVVVKGPEGSGFPDLRRRYVPVDQAVEFELLRPAPFGIVRGRVVDDSGRPVSTFRVRVVGSQRRQDSSTHPTDVSP